jgi:hypothetical protein
MKYAVEVALGSVVHMPGSVKMSSGIHKLTGEDSQTRRQYGDRISLL